MSYPNKTQIAIASHNKCQLDLSSQHITTSEFMQYSVAKVMELVPNQSIDIRHECFSRLSPLVYPTFGRANIHHRAFFVPMRVIFPMWNEFITDTPTHVQGTDVPKILSSVPTFTNRQLVSALYDVEQEFSVPVETVDEADFIYTEFSGSTDEYSREIRKFTRLGRFAYKLVRSLGYNPVFTNRSDDKYSSLPLLAATRIYYDYFYPPQYQNDEDSNFLNGLFVTRNQNVTYVLDANKIKRLFKILYRIPYASDYFTSAWDNPASPSIGHYSDVEIKDPTVYNSVMTNQSGTNTPEYAGTPIIVESGISQFAINALKALSDYMRRHQIVGSKALDRYMARFGIKLANEKLNRSVLINEYSQPLQIGDVYSTAETNGASLGEFAGKGLSYGDNEVKYTTDEYGYLFIISTITPVIQYYQGTDRMVTHKSRFDFYTPEFDNLGVQALGVKELYVPFDTTTYPLNYDNKVFGFTPRYAEYKRPYSTVTGDLILNRFKTSNEPWTLYRDLSFIYDDSNPESIDGVHHSLGFVMSHDSEQFNRIFMTTGIDEDENNDETIVDADHFHVFHNFTIGSIFPGKSLYNDYNFEDEDKSDKVTMDVGGTNVINK